MKNNRKSNIDMILEGEGAITLSAEEHAVLTQTVRLTQKLESMERRHIYFRGHADAYAYLKEIGEI